MHQTSIATMTDFSFEYLREVPKVPVTFRAWKAVLCLLCLYSKAQFQLITRYKTIINKIKLSVDKAKLTGLSARNCATIQLVWILKFVFGP